MTITSSPHLAPDDVARHTFASVRRGFDPSEVRDYLESLAVGPPGPWPSGRTSSSERLGRRRGAGGQPGHRRRPCSTTALGKETARVLQSAHEAAAEMVANAEAEATRLRTEAEAEVEQRRSDTEVPAGPDQPTRCWRRDWPKRGRSLCNSGPNSRRPRLSTRCGPMPRSCWSEARNRGPGHGRGGTGSSGPGARRPVQAPEGAPRPDRAATGRPRAARRDGQRRSAFDRRIAEDLFNAENDARLAAEVAGRDAARATRRRDARRSSPPSLLAEERAGRDRGRGRRPNRIDDVGPERSLADGARGGRGWRWGARRPTVEQVDALFAKLRAAQDEPADVTPAETDASSGH